VECYAGSDSHYRLGYRCCGWRCRWYGHGDVYFYFNRLLYYRAADGKSDPGNTGHTGCMRGLVHYAQRNNNRRYMEQQQYGCGNSIGRRTFDR
jgi:hypothetical protein